jgi:8-oxo-dGTP pyrophosphatase MutT (NUDIX family)
MLDLAALRAACAAEGNGSSDYDLSPDVAPPDGRKLRPAAVLVAVIDGPNGLEVVLTKRSSRLKHHPGQIAFPGGKLDAGEDNVTAALREAWEEIGLTHADVLGSLPPHETVTGFNVTPVIAHIPAPFTPVPEPGEVEEVFNVPMSHVMTPANYIIERRMWRGRWRQFYTVPYGPYYIWGATARMLRGLADRL